MSKAKLNDQNNTNNKHHQDVIEILSSDDDDFEKEVEEVVEVEGKNANESNNCCGKLKEDDDDDMGIAIPQANNDGSIIQESKSEMKMPWTYQNSAYVQHLAEMCYDILHDERWRTMDDESRLFQWETGDDLSVLFAFSKMFIPPTHDIGHNIKNDVNCEDHHARCMHLYSRLFHRKGPWYSLSDIFMKYYYRDYIRRESYAENVSNTEELEMNNVNDTDMSKNGMVTWEWIEKCLIDCFTDIHRLLSHGFIRTFDSEEECGSIVGRNESFCTMKEKEAIVRKLGGKYQTTSYHASRKEELISSSTKPRRKRTRIYRDNEILRQMRSQNTIFATSCKVLPVQKHVTSVLLENFAKKISVEISRQSHGRSIAQKSIQDIVCMIGNIWKNVTSSHINGNNFSMCIRLREQPLLTLRRCARLYLIAGGGPGNMRSDGRNGWLTVHEQSREMDYSNELEESRIFAGDVCTIPDPPDASDWHKVEFVGLNSRLGLVSCNFEHNYKRSLMTKMSKSKVSAAVSIKVFNSRQSFLMWELCVECRNMIDYLLEFNRLILYAHRKKGKEDNDLMETCPEMNCNLDFLSTSGRKIAIEKFMTCISMTRFSDTIHQKVETVISSLSPSSLENHSDSFSTDTERSIFVCGLIFQFILIYSLEEMPVQEMDYLIKRPWLRHLSWHSSMAYIVWDCIDTIEKRGYHHIAIDMLNTILHGKTCDQLCNFEIIRNGKYGYMQVLLSRRVRGKAYDRIIVDTKHVMRKMKTETEKKRSIRKEKQEKCQYEEYVNLILKHTASIASIPFRYVLDKSFVLFVS